MQNFFSAMILTVIACLLIVKCLAQPELFIYPNQDQIIAPVRERLSLECGCKGCAEEDLKSMEWLHEYGQEIRENIYVKKTKLTIKLIFPSPDVTDAGVYRCRLFESEAKVIVNFYKPIRFEECPEIQNLELGKPGHITCRATANPVPIMIWKKGGKVINSVDKFVVTIPSANKKDIGIYSVEAFVRETGKSLLQNIHVKEMTPPKIINFPEEFTIVQGENNTIKCEATGSEPLTYTWYNQFRPANEWDEYERESHAHTVDNGILTISNVIIRDLWYPGEYYMCEVRNPAGRDRAYAKVKFQRNEICDKRCTDAGYVGVLQLLFYSNEDLKRICSISVERMRCKIQYGEVCLGVDATDLYHRKQYDLLAAYQEIFCSENTLFYQVLLDNLKCFRKLAKTENNFRNGPCYFVTDDYKFERRIQNFTEVFEEKGLVPLYFYRNSSDILHDCIKMMTLYACESLYTEDKCGTVAMYVYIEILQKVVSVMEVFCKESFSLLPAMIQLLEI